MRDQNFSSEQQEVDEKLQLLDLLLADEKDGDGSPPRRGSRRPRGG